MHHEEAAPHSFHAEVEESLRRILGDSGAKALLFYLGDFGPENFEEKLHTILGDGAALVMNDLKGKGKGEGETEERHHWFGGFRKSVVEIVVGRVTGLSSVSLGFRSLSR